MDIWHMILETISAVVTWPAVVLVLGLVYRQTIIRAFGRLTHYRGFGQELDFGEKLAEIENAEKDTRVLSPASPDSGESAEPPQSDDWGRLAETEPSFTVLSSWNSLYASVIRLARSLSPKESNAYRSPNGALKVLVDAKMIRDADARRFRELMDLRNRVAHGQHRPAPGEALTYATMADVVRSQIESYARHPTKSEIWEKHGSTPPG